MAVDLTGLADALDVRSTAERGLQDVFPRLVTMQLGSVVIY